jgi:hypothetical protein
MAAATTSAGVRRDPPKSILVRWRLLVASLATVAVVGVDAHAAAPVVVRLDGVHSQHASFSGQLSGASGAAPYGFSVNGQPQGSCQAPSCDKVSLKLALPRATAVGALLVTAGTNETNTGLILRLFDGQGRQLAVADHGGGAIGASTDPSEPNQFSYLKYELQRGTYVLWIQDTGGVAPYNADVYWRLKN